MVIEWTKTAPTTIGWYMLRDPFNHSRWSVVMTYRLRVNGPLLVTLAYCTPVEETEFEWFGPITPEMLQDAVRYQHCIEVSRFPSICQDGKTWVSWKTTSPTSSVVGKSASEAIDTAMGERHG